MIKVANLAILLVTAPFFAPAGVDATDGGPPYQGVRPFALTMSGHDFNFGMDPQGPLLEAVVGETLAFTVHVPAFAEPHTFHLHGHPWLDVESGTIIDAKLIMPGQTHAFTVTAGLGEFTGEFLYHCHMEGHFAGGMWGILRIHPAGTDLPQRPQGTAGPVPL